MSDDISVKDLREKLGWTPTEIGLFLGVDRTSVAHYESGRRPGGAVRRLLVILANAAEAGNADALRPQTEPAE